MFATLVLPSEGCLAMALINQDQFILEDGVKSLKIISSELTGKAKVYGRSIASVVVSATEISWAGSSRSTSELELYAEDEVLLNPDIQTTVDENRKEAIILYLSRNVADQIHERMRASTAMVKCSILKCGKVFSSKDMCHNVAHHIIHDPRLASKLGIGFSQLPLCGMCGSHQALTYTA
eukprot:15324581-Ditylum_brightwellii.AAC.2